MKKLLVLYIVLIGYINGSYPLPVFGENGMVVSTSRQASIAGIEILKKGGNAIDACLLYTSDAADE